VFPLLTEVCLVGRAVEFGPRMGGLGIRRSARCYWFKWGVGRSNSCCRCFNVSCLSFLFFFFFFSCALSLFLLFVSWLGLACRSKHIYLACKKSGRASHQKVSQNDGPKILPDACAILLGRKGWLTFLPYVPQAIMLKCKDVSSRLISTDAFDFSKNSLFLSLPYLRRGELHFVRSTWIQNYSSGELAMRVTTLLGTATTLNSTTRQCQIPTRLFTKLKRVALFWRWVPVHSHYISSVKGCG